MHKEVLIIPVSKEDLLEPLLIVNNKITDGLNGKEVDINRIQKGEAFITIKEEGGTLTKIEVNNPQSTDELTMSKISVVKDGKELILVDMAETNTGSLEEGVIGVHLGVQVTYINAFSIFAISMLVVMLATKAYKRSYSTASLLVALWVSAELAKQEYYFASLAVIIGTMSVMVVRAVFNKSVDSFKKLKN